MLVWCNNRRVQLTAVPLPWALACTHGQTLGSLPHPHVLPPCVVQETIEKTDAQGKLLPEMILICQNLRNNLQHPNEYIRGVTLRFLCRIHEEELLEPLVPSGERSGSAGGNDMGGGLAGSDRKAVQGSGGRLRLSGCMQRPWQG